MWGGEGGAGGVLPADSSPCSPPTCTMPAIATPPATHLDVVCVGCGHRQQAPQVIHLIVAIHVALPHACTTTTHAGGGQGTHVCLCMAAGSSRVEPYPALCGSPRDMPTCQLPAAGASAAQSASLHRQRRRRRRGGAPVSWRVMTLRKKEAWKRRTVALRAGRPRHSSPAQAGSGGKSRMKGGLLAAGKQAAWLPNSPSRVAAMQGSPCPPCPALPCPALPCPALPCPALPRNPGTHP